jgi:Tfp pilus assembly protein PilF
MDIPDKISGLPRCWVVFGFLLGLIFFIYGNTFNASWHLDDYANIIDDPRLHLTDLTVESLSQATESFLQTPRDARPLARLTFALNWYFGGNSLFGYHLTNISIHAVTALLLFLTIANLLKLERTGGITRQYRYTIALLAAILWSFNPIQTQAVTYIVQRMAALATLFYVLAIYLYVNARTADNPSRKAVQFIGCLVSAVCAVASKENTATLPISLLLVDFLFIRNSDSKKAQIIFWGTTIFAGFIIFGLGVLIFFRGDPASLLNYNFRPFSPVERLLTEPRIILYYLSQIFYPVPTRLSIEHDVVVSTSLSSPWTTLPAIAGVLLLIGTGIYFSRRQPLLSLALLFFFLNHVIESSIIGLELMFEHRNYLPSLFLFVPIAAAIVGLLKHYRRKSRLLHAAIVGFVILLITGFGTGTYIRNLAWKTEKSLWEDAIAKAPHSGRAWHNLALSHYVPTGQYDKAMVLYRKALKLEKNNVQQESIILSNMAAVHYHRGDYDQAAKYWRKALVNHGNNPQIKYLLCLALIHTGDYDTAAAYLNDLVMKYPARFEANNLSGIVALLQGRYHEGLSHFKNGLRLQRSPGSVLINIGAAQSLAGNFIRAEWFFKVYLANRPDAKIALLWLMQNALNRGQLDQADKYLKRLHRLATKEELLSWFRHSFDGKLYQDNTLMPEITGTVRDRLVRQPQRSSSLRTY